MREKEYPSTAAGGPPPLRQGRPEKSERAVVLVLASLMTVLLITALIAPFVLAAYFGGGWLALNYVTVPGYLLFCAWADKRKTDCHTSAAALVRNDRSAWADKRREGGER